MLRDSNEANNEIRGVVPPIITPFTPDGRIYEQGVGNLIEFQIENGVHALFAIGSYGSFPLLETDERERLAEMILGRVNGRIPVMVHVGSPLTATAVRLAIHAAGAGANSVAAVVPFYYAASAYKDDVILGYFESICTAVDVPVYIYNNPKTTGFHASPSLVRKLAGVGVSGMKDSSGDFMYMVEVIRQMEEADIDFNLMAGTAGFFQPMFSQGSFACVGGSANTFPEVLVELYKALRTGCQERASELQSLVIGIRTVQAIRGFRPASTYAALRMRGVDVGTVRPPWREPDAEAIQIMESEFKKLGLITE